MAVPIRMFTNEKTKADEKTIGILKEMSKIKGIEEAIVALPDLHYKASYHTPTGVVVATKKIIIPAFINPNCGMSLILLPVSCSEIDKKKMDMVFAHLQKNISADIKTEPTLSVGDLKKIIKLGAKFSFEKYSLDFKDLKNFEYGGNMLKEKDFKDVWGSIPKESIDAGLRSFGALGYGNHFLELQKISKIINPQIAGIFGIKKGQLCAMLHSDSRAFGRSIHDFYSKKAKKLFGLHRAYKMLHYKLSSSRIVPGKAKKILEKLNAIARKLNNAAYSKADILRKASRFETINADSEEGKKYANAVQAATNFAFANRAYMVYLVQEAFSKVLGRKIKARILHDGNHDSLQQEEIDGKVLWMHRNGAAMARPQSYYAKTRLFSKTGQPVIIPSSMGNVSFLCSAKKGCRKAFYSAPHGTGRLIDRPEARKMFTNSLVREEVRKMKVKIYDYDSGNIKEESPSAFKDINEVIKVVKKYKMAEPVAIMKPIGVLKGWT